MTTEEINQKLSELTKGVIEDEDSLNDYWCCTFEKIVKKDKRLKIFYESEEFSDLDICIEGKESPDPQALQLAAKVLKELPFYCYTLDKVVGFREEEYWWLLSSLCFPKQNYWTVIHKYTKNFEKITIEIKPKEIFYFHLWSEYGSDSVLIILKDQINTIFTATFREVLKDQQTYVVDELKEYKPEEKTKTKWKLC